jgi:hypothetical protein
MRTRRNKVSSTCRTHPNSVFRSCPKLVEKILMQPWFLPRRVSVAIHKMVPVDFYRKMRYVFDHYGCLICGTDSGCHSNGMRRNRHKRTCKKILLSLRRPGRHGGKPRLDLELFRQQKLARKLLSRLIAEGQNAPRRPHHGIKQNNPVCEAFASRLDRG